MTLEPAHAGAGIAALSVAHFGRPGLSERLREIPLEYFSGALRILRDELLPGAPIAGLLPRLGRLEEASDEQVDQAAGVVAGVAVGADAEVADAAQQ